MPSFGSGAPDFPLPVLRRRLMGAEALPATASVKGKGGKLSQVTVAQ